MAEEKKVDELLDELEQELDEVRRRAMKFFKLRNKDADKISIGASFEGRAIWAMKTITKNTIFPMTRP